ERGIDLCIERVLDAVLEIEARDEDDQIVELIDRSSTGENGRARAGVARVADPVSVRILLLFIRFVRAVVIAVRNAVAIAIGARRTLQPTALDAVGETVDHVRRVAVDTGKEAGVVVARSAPVVPLAFERE